MSEESTDHNKPGGMTIADWRKVLMLDCIKGHLIWTVTRGSALAGSRAGCRWNTCYRLVNYKGRVYMEHRIIWALLHGRWPSETIDHINMIRDDNRPCNLREATVAENNYNKPISDKNTTGFKGVTLNKGSGRYVAKIMANTKIINLGTFDTAEEAYAAYVNAARIHHGQFARI